jgi:hypothetical protein
VRLDFIHYEPNFNISTYLNLAPRLRIGGAIPLRLQYLQGMDRDNLAFVTIKIHVHWRCRTPFMSYGVNSYNELHLNSFCWFTVMCEVGAAVQNQMVQYEFVF